MIYNHCSLAFSRLICLKQLWQIIQEETVLPSLNLGIFVFVSFTFIRKDVTLLYIDSVNHLNDVTCISHLFYYLKPKHLLSFCFTDWCKWCYVDKKKVSMLSNFASISRKWVFIYLFYVILLYWIIILLTSYYCCVECKNETVMIGKVNYKSIICILILFCKLSLGLDRSH